MAKKSQEKHHTQQQGTSNLKNLSNIILNAVGEGIYGQDQKGNVIFINPVATQLLGYTQEELLGRPIHDIIHHTKNNGSTYPQNQCPIYKASTTGGTFTGTEDIFYRKDGTSFSIEYTTTPLYEDQDIIGSVVCFTDITKRKISEHNLQTLNRELERSNRELQDFASVASHDLQEPLRKIQAFSDRLVKKYQDNLPNEAQDYLDRINKAAFRMQTLINDLLTFSRVTAKAQPVHKTNLGDIVKDVLSDLEVAIEDTGATVTVKKLPTIIADPLQMRQLFQNLIGNALKFHHPDKAPHIAISTQISQQKEQSEKHINGKYTKIVVEDNGIGFDEKYSDRIFSVFQRLHATNEFNGNGVGLAVCRKIVERHNGSISAKSTPGEGSQFIITLPYNHISLNHTSPITSSDRLLPTPTFDQNVTSTI